MQRKPLGRGLKALIPDHIESVVDLSDRLVKSPVTGRVSSTAGKDELLNLPVESISPNTLQPREFFDAEKIDELAASIKEKGVMQPVIVRRAGKGFELIAGERRWRAAQAAGMKAVPALVKVVSDSESLEMALIENIQRENLNPVEEGRAYKKLSEKYGLTQEEVARKVGKERSTVANAMRLLKLPLSIQDDVSEGLLSMGHARALLAVDGRERQLLIRDKIVKNGLSVRAAENLVALAGQKAKAGKSEKRDVNTLQFETNLQNALGTKVKIVNRSGRGRVEVYFHSEEEFEGIFNKFVGG